MYTLFDRQTFGFSAENLTGTRNGGAVAAIAKSLTPISA